MSDVRCPNDKNILHMAGRLRICTACDTVYGAVAPDGLFRASRHDMVTQFVAALAASEARAEQAERERDESLALLRDRSPLFQDYEDAKARIDALTAEVERLRGWQSGQTHYVGCWREHRSCALATIDFEGARRERAEMALQGMSDRLTRVINVLLENSEGTSTDGQPCWCGVDPVYSAHADWCVSARRVVSEHNAAANV